MLVWVASYPRSGNTLTLMALQEVFGERLVGSIYEDDLNLDSGPYRAIDPWERPPELRGLSGVGLLEALRERPEIYWIKTHRPIDATDPAPALHIVRDGRDALVSQAHFIAHGRWERMPFNQRIARLIHPGVPGQGRWSDSVKAWRKRSGPLALVRFEELVRDPAAVVGTACQRLGVDLKATGEMPSFEYLHGKVPKVYRRGIVGSWRDEMAPHLQERFWRVHGAQMEALGYHR